MKDRFNNKKIEIIIQDSTPIINVYSFDSNSSEWVADNYFNRKLLRPFIGRLLMPDGGGRRFGGNKNSDDINEKKTSK